MTLHATQPAPSPRCAATALPAGMDAAAAAYFLGGAGDEITLRANERAWRSIGWLPRVLSTPTQVDISTTLLGQRWPTPWLVAPMAHLRLAHPEAELGAALASAVQGAGFVLSTQATVPLEAVADAVRAEPQRGPLWFQLYPYGGREDWWRLAQRAQRAGYEAIVLTVDAPLQWPSAREQDAGFALPPDWPQPNLPAAAPRGTLETLLGCALRWDDVAWLRRRLELPLVLKGVLHPDDARRICDHNLGDALIVSNHGGRVLDGLPATAQALPAVLAAVDGRRCVLVDGGLRCAADAVKALALGADAVLVGRPVVQALAQDGARGVARFWRHWRDAFQATLALLGCASPHETRSVTLIPMTDATPHRHAGDAEDE
ncbi:4-hydroxymandelate oxidase [Tepidimonas alkaliphilus]|uniref:4-hydroxymandelate oxidase n=2 Tax=Tepidimonas TaxID=114248 RepID=A0A554W9Y0_9BURK|nr:alpha-hydroxy acid oxidase [Tepidimonas alkaliphilus]TSE20391.1 4-hydroxymandelate oxidase [Tepidimonas alkaliphilus]